MIIFCLTTGNSAFSDCEWCQMLRNKFVMYRVAAILIQFSVTALSRVAVFSIREGLCVRY